MPIAMTNTIAMLCIYAATIGVVITLLQTIALALHALRRRPPARTLPPISILKPLAGLDDGLADHLERFADLDYPSYELLLGVASERDAAYPVACRFAARFPNRVRVVIQRGKPGLNPKVCQLMSLERAARHEVLTISDSNVRVTRSYLRDIAAQLEDDVGVVTHAIAGAGERSFGAMLDNAHMTTTIGPGVVAAKRFAGKDVVVGKSMTLQRRHLQQIGGFERFKDVLAEDYFLGQAMLRLGKRITFGNERVFSVSRDHGVGRFFDRYLRWSVMHRFAVGRPVYAAELLLCPISFAVLSIAISPSAAALALVVAKLGLDLAVLRLVRARPITIEHAAALIVKDMAIACMLAYGFFSSTVVWRGHRRRVLAGTVLERLPNEAPAAEVAR